MVKVVTMGPRVWAVGLEQSVAMEPWRLVQATVIVAESGEFNAGSVLRLSAVELAIWSFWGDDAGMCNF